MSVPVKLDASRGTVLWAFTAWRRDALVALMHDLVDLEATGLSEIECRAVKNSLEKVCNVFSTIPDRSFLRGTILNAMTKFADAYAFWNDEHRKPGKAQNAIALRKKGIRMMQNYRNLLATRERQNRHILQNELDFKLIDDLYTALGDLAKGMPQLFKTVNSAIELLAKTAPPKK